MMLVSFHLSPFFIIPLLLIHTKNTFALNENSIKNTVLLRIRREDGSMEKVHIIPDDISLKNLIQPFRQSKDSNILIDNIVVKDQSKSVSELGVKNGTMIAIQRLVPRDNTKPSFSLPEETFQPFPDLAKNLPSAIRARARQRINGKSSFGDIANLQSSLHVVEPQAKGRIQRVYICSQSAERFHLSCQINGPRVGILFGNIQRERLDLKPIKARTSLSTTPSSLDYCDVARIHAIWEPAQQPTQTYDAEALSRTQDSTTDALLVASYLGLRPLGWIFTYSESRHDEDGLPVWAPDVKAGSKLQIEQMKATHEGSKFVTLAMDATNGSTEAFQISDVTVQMVSEGLLLDEKGRIVSTKHPISVDGRETNTLDTVLCLINTALLSHQGIYAGTSSKKLDKSGAMLTIKTKKSLLQAMEDDSALLIQLCDFSLLLALNKLLSQDEMQILCTFLQKWTRGQKKGTKLSASMKLKLRSILQA